MATRPEPGALLAAAPMRPVPHRVTTRVVDGPTVVTLGLVPVDPADATAAPGPGQFCMLWAPGVGEIPVSVSGLGDDGTLELTVRAVGATSTAVVTSEVGRVLGLRGPYGTSWPIAHAAGRHVAVVAGGLGLAPLRRAITSLAAGRPRPHRLTVVIGARQPDQLLYPVDRAAWTAAGAEVLTTVDSADRSWQGAVGTATELIERLGVAPDLAFVCGPELMMLSAARALVDAGTPPEHVHVSLERNMHCGVAHCGRCQLGPLLLCRDGAVVRWDRVEGLMTVRGR